jgi:pyroglutamyl-peptidase
MPRILITAFGPYSCWSTNASWLTIVEFTKDIPDMAQVVTRRYPVDFKETRRLLEEDLRQGFDYALHLGQAPGSSSIQLETIGINVGGHSSQHPDEFQPLVDDGPVAFRSQLPMARLAAELRDCGIPAHVSYHAGTYLCNATLYLSHFLAQKFEFTTRSAFIHLPLDVSQVLHDGDDDLPSLPANTAARALRIIVEHIAQES